MAYVRGYRGRQGAGRGWSGKGGYSLEKLSVLLMKPKQKRVETEEQRLARLERVKRYMEAKGG